jgi:hypothetical protein
MNKKVVSSILPPVGAKSTGASSLFAGFGGVPGDETSLNGTKSEVLPSASVSTVPISALGKGPSPFGNSATKSTPFGTPGIFGNAGTLGPPLATNGGAHGKDNKPNKPGGETSAKTMQSSFAGFGGAPIFDAAGAGKPIPFASISKPSPFENISQPLQAGRGGTACEGDPRDIAAGDPATPSTNKQSEETSAKPLGPMADSDAAQLPAAIRSSTSGASGEDDRNSRPLQSFGTPSAPTFGTNPSLPEVTASQTATVHQKAEPAKPFTWPNTFAGVTHQNGTPSVGATQSLDAMSGNPMSSNAPLGPSTVLSPATPQITAFGFGTLINGTGAMPPPTFTSASQPPQTSSRPPTSVPVHAEHFKFGLSSQQKSAVDSSTASSDDAKLEQSNTSAGPNVFLFGNPPAPASVGETTAGPPDVAAVPSSLFASSPDADPRPIAESSAPNPFGECVRPSAIL